MAYQQAQVSQSVKIVIIKNNYKIMQKSFYYTQRELETCIELITNMKKVSSEKEGFNFTLEVLNKLLKKTKKIGGLVPMLEK